MAEHRSGAAHLISNEEAKKQVSQHAASCVELHDLIADVPDYKHIVWQQPISFQLDFTWFRIVLLIQAQNFSHTKDQLHMSGPSLYLPWHANTG